MLRADKKTTPETARWTVIEKYIRRTIGKFFWFQLLKMKDAAVKNKCFAQLAAVIRQCKIWPNVHSKHFNLVFV